MVYDRYKTVVVSTNRWMRRLGLEKLILPRCIANVEQSNVVELFASKFCSRRFDKLFAFGDLSLLIRTSLNIGSGRTVLARPFFPHFSPVDSKAVGPTAT